LLARPSKIKFANEVVGEKEKEQVREYWTVKLGEVVRNDEVVKT
jgi:hypothetical protein